MPRVIESDKAQTAGQQHKRFGLGRGQMAMGPDIAARLQRIEHALQGSGIGGVETVDFPPAAVDGGIGGLLGHKRRVHHGEPVMRRPGGQG